jgi:YesN/AraC family two-component response regulator
VFSGEYLNQIWDKEQGCKEISVLTEDPGRSPTDNYLFHGSCLYIRENFHRPITHRFNVLASHLSHLFREQCPMRLVDYLSRIRIERATFMLKQYRFHLAEVASRGGYGDVNCFCRACKGKA